MTVKISDFDIEELIRGMYTLDDDDDIDIVQYVNEELGIEWESLCRFIKDIMPLITVGVSPITDTLYKGFGKNGVFYIKINGEE